MIGRGDEMLLPRQLIEGTGTPTSLWLTKSDATLFDCKEA